MLDRHLMLHQAFFYLKHSEADIVVTIDDPRGWVRAGVYRARSSMKRTYRSSANSFACPPYWYDRQQELQVIFATNGSTTIFVTLSAADNQWGVFPRDRSGLLP